MKSQLFWLVPDHVLYWKLSGSIPAEELCAMSRFISKQASQSNNQKIHIILDAGGIHQLDHPSHDAREAFNKLAKNTRIGKVMAVTRNLKVELQFNALNRSFGLRWRNVNGFAEATRLLKYSDTSLRSTPQQPPSETPLQRAD
ncbi:MAG: hypothetical protein Q9P01_19875 [Anaerolineae bacterium]|nr:hypothetical protein [Anaerolineae bacterium]MDQ7037008.1 hypothetical protein [Anaerolineae bacterium]